MTNLQFLCLDPFSFLCLLDGDLIGKVDYSPAMYYSWIFRNAGEDVVTFGSTKYQAVKAYISLLGGIDS